jgi:hypothetical protein
MSSANAQLLPPSGIDTEATQASPLFPLFAPLGNLLQSGGDERLSLLPNTHSNQYGCSTVPRPGILECASSTATTISKRAYRRAEGARSDLLHEIALNGADTAFESRIEALRCDLRSLLGLSAGDADIVFSPSGTDSALHLAYITSVILGDRFKQIVVGSDETGSRMALASAGYHFSTRAALGAAVSRGSGLDGFADTAPALEFPLRDPSGCPSPLETIDQEVVDAVESALKRGQKVVLHAMDCSKTGLHGPSLGVLQYISQRWSSDVLVVVDACQMRLSRKRLRRYLSINCAVMITGSKFFTGPPFSGAILLPSAVSAKASRAARVPKGLGAYTAGWSWPPSWRGVRAQLPARKNFGEWLRWEAALEEMHAYYSTPSNYRALGLRKFADCVSRFITSNPALSLVPIGDRKGSSDDDEFSCPTIFSFKLTSGSGYLTPSAVSRIHRVLMDGRLNDPKGHSVYRLGQPVIIGRNGSGQTAALRASASSRLIAEAWQAGDSLQVQPNLDHELLAIGEALEMAAYLATEEGM